VQPEGTIPCLHRVRVLRRGVGGAINVTLLLHERHDESQVTLRSDLERLPPNFVAIFADAIAGGAIEPSRIAGL